MTAALALAGCGAAGGADAPLIAQDRASVRVSPLEAAQDSDPGEFAADFLRAKNFTSIHVEVDYPAGRPPEPAALDLLRRRLEERCDKPHGVLVFLDDEIPASAFPPVLASADLENLEDEFRDAYSDGATGVAVLYVLCVSGASAEDSKSGEVAGLAYRGASLALFLDNTDQGADPFVTTAKVQGTTLVHETGHLLGLVNSGVPMSTPHEDLLHPGHDANPASVMSWSIDVPRIGPDIDDPAFAPYGPECIADLQAFGGK